MNGVEAVAIPLKLTQLSAHGGLGRKAPGIRDVSTHIRPLCTKTGAHAFKFKDQVERQNEPVVPGILPLHPLTT